MNLEIREMTDLSGTEAKVYSVVLDNNSNTLLEQFFEENQSRKRDLRKVLHNIKVMANYTGCRREFFKEGEGRWGDGMVALRNTGLLRLYGVYFHQAVVLFGSGGLKPPGVRSWQDDPDLRQKGEQMEAVAAEIRRMICDGELKVMEDGTLLNL